MHLKPGVRSAEGAIFDISNIGSALSVANVNHSPGIKLWPNPANNSFELQNKAQIGGRLTITDLTGKVVLTNKYIKGNEKERIDLSAFPAAMYIVHLHLDNGQMETGKLIKL